MSSQSKPAWPREFKIQALLKLKANGGNIKRTAREIQVPVSTLRSWRDSTELSADDAFNDAERIFEVQIATHAERLANKLVKKIETLVDSDEAKLNECVNAFEKLTRIRATSKAEAPRAQKEEEEDLPEELISNMLDTYRQGLLQANTQPGSDQDWRSEEK